MSPDLLFFASALVAGLMNSVAGGGTFLTFPVLLFYGVPPITANATSTVGLWVGTLASVFGYKKEFRDNKNDLKKLGVVTALGGAMGAGLLLVISDASFKSLVPWLLLFATFVFTFGNRIVVLIRKGNNELTESKDFDLSKMDWKGYLFLLVVATYGGFFGAGVGIITLAMFQFISSGNIHSMNALKTFNGTIINFVAVIIFVCSGIVDYRIAFIMVCGSVIGGFFGAKLALRTKPQTLRKVIVWFAWAITIYSFYEL